MRVYFAHAAMLSCLVQGVTDPKTQKHFFLIDCENNVKKVLLKRHPKKLRAAIREAHKWLDPQLPKQYTVSAETLGYKPNLW